MLGADSVGGVAGATGTADTTAATPTPTPDSDAARAARRDDRITVSTATGTLLVTGTSNREAETTVSETTPNSTPASDGSLLGLGAIVVALLAVGGWLGRR
jgi:cobalamin biosynthesis Mg chelatase CobN